jgi:hypothetical protein
VFAIHSERYTNILHRQGDCVLSKQTFQPTRNKYTGEVPNIYATRHSELTLIRNSYNEEDCEFYSPLQQQQLDRHVADLQY